MTRPISMRMLLPYGLLLACGGTLLPAAVAQEERPATADDDEPDQTLQQWRKLYRQVMGEWSVKRAGEEPVRLTLKDEPVMYWSSLNDFNGSVFVFTHAGKPELIGTVFSFSHSSPPPARRVMCEFQSLSEHELQLLGPDRPRRVLRSGYQAARLDETVPVPTNRQLLRAQAKQLAGRYSSHMTFEEKRWELRLLPNPIFQYEPDAKSETSDACLIQCLFAFVGLLTDPEVLLLVEARRTKQGAEWVYQPLRFSNRPLFVEFDGTPVWESAGPGSDESSRGYLLDRSRLMTLENLKRGQ